MKNNREVVKYRTQGTCCELIQVMIEDDVIQDAVFYGGCQGNLEGIRRLIKGMKTDDVITALQGVDCGGKGTSCPDQLARCLINYKSKKLQNVK